MQQRRYRPGDVLDDYCPRERRITDHAIVAMIDDHIKQTRCVVCDAEHEYKDGKVPPQRRKKPQPALFTQVLDGITGGQPPARVAHAPAEDNAGDVLGDEDIPPADAPALVSNETLQAMAESPAVTAAASVVAEDADPAPREEGGWRRQLIRAALPRPEGQPPPPVSRPATEFTVRQPGSNGRGHRHGRPRGGGGFSAQGNGNHGQPRFGRSGSGPGEGTGQGGRRRRGRGGKKNN
jgi:hypothetical protein